MFWLWWHADTVPEIIGLGEDWIETMMVVSLKQLVWVFVWRILTESTPAVVQRIDTELPVFDPMIIPLLGDVHRYVWPNILGTVYE